MAESLPATAVVRVSRATFDPNGVAEFAALVTKQADYLVPAIKQLPGLLHWYTGVSPEGSTVQISVWDSEEHAKQLDTLRQMVVVARGEMEAIGGTFIRPIINYPITWNTAAATTEPLPPTAVVRAGLATFEPDRFAEFDALARKQSEYLTPAIGQLPGFRRWYSAVSPKGSYANVSVWDSEEHAEQMNDLKEMAVVARGEMAAVGGITFHPIVNYPMTWTI